MLLITSVLLGLLCKATSGVANRPLVLPIPLEMPNRNDRADQCWLRVEDVEIIETFSVYCTVAHTFLSYYIHDYNNRKMTEDAVDVSLWYETPNMKKDKAYGPPSSENGITDWKLTTFLDPITNRRVYVSKNAACRLLMYSRWGVTNYEVDCATILYFVNDRSGSVSLIPNVLMILSVFLAFNAI